MKSYIQAVSEEVGVVTKFITMAAATAIVRKADRTLLGENGGPITITNNWAKSLMHMMNFVKRRGSLTASNKRQITAVFCGALFLPQQLIY